MRSRLVVSQRTDIQRHTNRLGSSGSLGSQRPSVPHTCHTRRASTVSGGNSRMKRPAYQRIRPSCSWLVRGTDLPCWGYRPPRWDMISAEFSESRPSRCAVASRALTRRPRPRAGSYEEDGGGAGYEAPDAAVPVRRAINVQLARVTRGQPRLLQSTRTGRSAARSGVAALFPKLIVRVRFPSPAPR
jgi:hypothetical protein